MQTSIFDITARYHGGNENSQAANKSLNSKQVLRGRIVSYVYSCGLNGATSDEVEQALSIPHQSASARLSEAKRLEIVVDSGVRRKTRSGRAASVLVYRGLLV